MSSYTCETCDYKTTSQNMYNKHITSAKHLNAIAQNATAQNATAQNATAQNAVNNGSDIMNKINELKAIIAEKNKIIAPLGRS